MQFASAANSKDLFNRSPSSKVEATGIIIEEGHQISLEQLTVLYMILVRNYESPPSIKDIVNDILYIFSHRIIPTTMFYIMVSFRGSPCFPRNGI